MRGFIGISRQVLDSGPQRLYDKSGCFYTCEHRSFDLKVVANNIMQIGTIADRNYTHKVLFYASPQGEEVRTETYIYDFYNLIGDIGGVLGLLLGASLLSVYDETKDFCVKWWQKRNVHAEESKEDVE